MRRRRLIAILRAFFDDSGSHDGSTYFVVGGYIASASMWEALSAEWSFAMKYLGIDWFHMSEAEKMSGPKGNQRNGYGWDWRMRDAVISALGKLVNQMRPRGVACAVNVSLWERYVKTEMAKSPRFLAEAGFPYHEAYSGCLAHLNAICGKAGVPLDSVEVLFAEQKRDGPRARESVRHIHNNFGLRDPHFGVMQESAPLQCADALAWLVNKICREGDGFRRRPRYSGFLESLGPVMKFDEQLLKHYGKPMPPIPLRDAFLCLPGTLGELPEGL